MKRSYCLLLAFATYSFLLNFSFVFAQSVPHSPKFFMESVLEGKLGKSKQLRLKISVKDSIITGYCIDKDHDVQNNLEGFLLENKSTFILKEVDAKKNVLGIFKGKIDLSDVDGWDWKGAWHAPDGQKTKKFTFHEFNRYTIEQEDFEGNEFGITNYRFFLSNVTQEKSKMPSCHEVNIHYPQLTNLPDETIQNSVNQKISELLSSEKRIKKYKIKDKYIDKCRVVQDETSHDIYDKIHGSAYNTEMLTPEILSLSYSLSEDLGGEHNSETYGYINYNLLTGKTIRLEELFDTTSHYIQFIAAYCLTTLVNELIHKPKKGQKPANYKTLKAAVLPKVNSFNNFSLHKEALIIMFPYYTIGRNWEHRVNEYIVIPYKKLKPYFNPNGLIYKYLYLKQ